MSARRVSVRKIRELLRLLWECGLSQRQVAGCCGIGKTTVVECVARARRSLESSAKKPLPMHSGTRRADHQRRIGNGEKVFYDPFDVPVSDRGGGVSPILLLP